MTFPKAVSQAPQLAGAYQRGLRALKARDKLCVSVNSPRKLTGSVDIDSTLASVDPHGHRWDYGVGISQVPNRSDLVVWIEIHPAKNSEISVVLDKLAWLREWLHNNAPDLEAMPCKHVWVSSGSTSITQGSQLARSLATKGLQLAGGHLTL